METPTKTPPDMRLRRAKQGHWEPCALGLMPGDDGELQDQYWQDDCEVCGGNFVLNILGVCRACNFKEKLASLTVIAEPAVLKDIRREHGIAGETNPWDAKVKQAKAEKMDEDVARAKGAMTREAYIAKYGLD